MKTAGQDPKKANGRAGAKTNCNRAGGTAGIACFPTPFIKVEFLSTPSAFLKIKCVICIPPSLELQASCFTAPSEQGCPPQLSTA